MAYKTNRFGENVGQDYDIFPDPQYGSIKHGPRAPQYRFHAPRAGVRQSFKAPARGPMIDTRLPAGSLLAGAEIGAQAYLGHKEKQRVAAEEARAEALRKGMKLARANNKVANLQALRAAGGYAPPRGRGLPVPPPPLGQPSATPSPTGLNLSTTPPPMAGGTIATGPTATPPSPPSFPSLPWSAPRGSGAPTPPPPSGGVPSIPMPLQPPASGGDPFIETIRMASGERPAEPQGRWKDDSTMDTLHLPSEIPSLTQRILGTPSSYESSSSSSDFWNKMAEGPLAPKTKSRTQKRPTKDIQS